MTKRILTILILVTITGKGCSPKLKTSDRAAKLASEASLLMSKDDFAGAKPKLIMASELDPECAEYHVGAAICAVKLGDSVLARKHYANARNILAKQTNDNPERVDDYLMLLICLGEKDEAKKQLKKSEKQFPQNLTIKAFAESFDTIADGLTEFRVKD